MTVSELEGAMARAERAYSVQLGLGKVNRTNSPLAATSVCRGQMPLLFYEYEYWGWLLPLQWDAPGIGAICNHPTRAFEACSGNSK